MKDSITRDRISAKLGRVLYFEIEGAGLASVILSAVICSIYNYANSHKNKS